MKRIRRYAWLFLSTACGGYAVICLAVWLFQDRLLFHPEAGNRVTPAALGLAYEEVWLTPDPQLPQQRVHGWFIPANGASVCVLFCHGNARNIGAHLDVAASANRLGQSLFLFDYRGYGQSGGSPSEENMYADARAAWEHLITARGIPPERIVLQGRSLGGGVASWLAEQVRPAGLVLESTFTSLPDAARDRLPFLPASALCRFRFSTGERLQTIRLPALFVCSQDDELIPPAHIRRLHRAYAGSPIRDLLVLRGTHNDCYVQSRELYERGLERFYSQVLPHAASNKPQQPETKPTRPAQPGRVE